MRIRSIMYIQELRTQNSGIVYLTVNLQIHAIHKLNIIQGLI